MEEATWYVKQRSNLEESLWVAKQRFRVLQDYRQEIRGLWQDDASSEVNGRYFNPHRKDSEQVFIALGKQLSLLQKADSELETAKQNGLEISQLLEKVEKLLEFAHQDVSRSHIEYSYFQDQNLAARAELPVIEQLINQANSCCS